MKNFVFLILFIFIYGCSAEGDEDSHFVFTNLEGTVIGPISCNMEVFEIKIENSNLMDTIGVVKLSNDFQHPNLKIKFDLIEFKDSNLACVVLRPDNFFEILNVQLNEKL